MPTPKAVVTLKVADQADKTLWVTESPAQVLSLCDEDSMVTLTRWYASRTAAFHTRGTNIINVREYD